MVLGALAALALLFMLASAKIAQLDEQILHRVGPQEGYYWTVAQYQISYLRAREVIARLALKDSVSEDELAIRLAILRSKEAILTNPSELTESFETIEGYSEAVAEIRAFHARVSEMLARPGAIQQHAGELLNEFAGVEDTIMTLANDARVAEIEARGSTMDSLVTRRKALWFAMWMCFALALIAVLVMNAAWTRQQRAAEAREAALEAERLAVQAKTQFLGMVSHELRSPLQSIVSALDVLESRRALPEDAEVTKRIRRSANELAVQLRDMLTLARGQAGRIELRPEVFEACELVHETTEDARKEAEAKGLRFSVLTPNESMFVVADGVRIGQVLQNLVGNAVRYTERGGVTVTLESLSEGAERLRVRIADTGPGLPESAALTLAHGVEPATAQYGQRRGIGLAVVRALLTQLDGKVTVSAIADEEGGTEFELTVPVVVAEDKPPEQGSGEGRLLIVDDRPELLTGFAQVCSDLGLSCDTAPSAAIALNLLAAHAYGAVLIDLGMPGKTGAELAAEVRTSELNGSARLIAMTAGRGPGEDDLRVFDAVLEKPVTREQLAAAMQLRTSQPTPPG